MSIGPTPASAASITAAAPWRGGWSDGVRYGLLGLPLAFVALPLYVILPAHYASSFGVPLAALGAVLLGARLLDAVTDPLIGRGIDRLFLRSPRAVWQLCLALSVVLALGFWALFFPAVEGTTHLLWWAAIVLAVTYVSFGAISVAHQAWGAMLGGDERMRAQVVGWREGLALVGVLAASVLPSLAGLGASVIVFAALLLAGLLAWRQAPTPRPLATTATQAVWRPFGQARFRVLLGIFLCNGIASAIPATLVLFFVRDRLQLPAWEPVFLAAYFAAGALSVPVWVRIVARVGLARAWLWGMLLAVLTFIWAATLGAGDATAFLLVCALSGMALGADLTIPGALLAGVVHDSGDRGRAEGAYFGWWNFATKLNLAAAAGLALPLLAAFGYSPGERDPQALWALTMAYCLLPCVLKLMAAGLLWATWGLTPRNEESRP